MDKKRLSAVLREEATQDMVDSVKNDSGAGHVATAKLVDDDTLVVTFYRKSDLRTDKTKPVFRTFFDRDDYISQDLRTEKVRWLTSSLERMEGFRLYDYHYDSETRKSTWELLVSIRSRQEKELISKFFSDYAKKDDKYAPWSSVCSFQTEVMGKRLEKKHRKVTDVIDKIMEPIKEVPVEFYNWVWENGMSFSRYLIYQDSGSGEAECECTHCKRVGKVIRKNIRLRNNEKGECPFCGSKVTIKARGRMPCRIDDERWFLYVDPMEDGFLLRYFCAHRNIRSDSYVANLIENSRVEQSIHEYSRVFYSFPEGMKNPVIKAYEWAVYKQRGKSRWCPDEGKINCMESILYPGNLPQAWAHTPMKYSALEIMSASIPTTALRYEDGIKVYMKFPKLEWLCKMGLSNLAKHLIDGRSGVARINKDAGTIFEILGLSKENTRTLQAINGTDYHLRLLQVAQSNNIRLTPEQLVEYYNTFECNTDLLVRSKKVSLHKLCKYIAKESERYPLGEKGGCWQYSYMRYEERTDPRIERQQNMAKDWLEYLGWCKELGYDLDNMFWYMPNNFKKVHDRTAKEYQEMKDRKAAALQKRKEALVKKVMEKTEREMEFIFKRSGASNNFSVKGNGLVLVVPKSMQDIRNEGIALHHCVGTYVDRVMKGETNIFFVRKSNDPDTPYFTMEYRGGKVVQCRGLRNCGMPTEVKAFVTVFEKRMNEVVVDEAKKERRCG